MTPNFLYILLYIPSVSQGPYYALLNYLNITPHVERGHV